MWIHSHAINPKEGDYVLTEGEKNSLAEVLDASHEQLKVKIIATGKVIYTTRYSGYTKLYEGIVEKPKEETPKLHLTVMPPSAKEEIEENEEVDEPDVEPWEQLALF